MQVDPRLSPCSPRVDRAWFQRLKLCYGKVLSSFDFNLNLRRLTEACLILARAMVRRCMLTPSNPR